MGKNLKMKTYVFNKKTVDEMNGVNKNNKCKSSPIYLPSKKRK